jgi:hypothetical protein
MPLSFLLIGLGWKELQNIVPADKLDIIKPQLLAGLEQSKKEFIDKGYGFKLVNYELDDELDELKGVLKETKYDGVIM